VKETSYYRQAELILEVLPLIDRYDAKELSDIFAREFQGMTRQSATVPELVAARDEIVKLIHETLTDEERRFIVSVKEGEPRWDLLGVNGIRDLPAVQWKLQNIGNMLPSRHRQALEKLRRCLNV
jgi:hypothetical protein